MRIGVLVKEVPDTYGERSLNEETGLVERSASDRVLDEINERAVELAVSHAEAHPGVEVIALMMAPESATPTLRKALAMGADRGVLISDDLLIGADLTLTAEVLCAALKRLEFDLVVAGERSTDGAAGAVATMVAELLELPQLPSLSEVDLGDTSVSGISSLGDTVYKLRADLPAVVSVTERLPEGRFPSFKGILAAKKKPIETLTLEDLPSVEVLQKPRVIMTELAVRPPRVAGVKIRDEGDAGSRIVEFLSQNSIV